MTIDSRVASSSQGFRSRYLGYDELSAQLHCWAEAFPAVVRLESLCKSEEGRDLWLRNGGEGLDGPQIEQSANGQPNGSPHRTRRIN
jgi:hypothetical protein